MLNIVRSRSVAQRCMVIAVTGSLVGCVTLCARADPLADVKKTETTDAPKGQSAGPEITLAVVRFASKGPSVELAKLGQAIGEMTAGELSRLQGLRVVERAGASQLIDELGLAEGGLVENNDEKPERSEVAAEWLVAGSFVADTEKTSVKVRLVNVQTEKQIGEWDIAGETDDLATLSQDVTKKIAGALGLDATLKRAVPKPEQKESPLVAVLAWKNLGASTRLDPMEQGFAELLQGGMSGFKNVRLVERNELHRALAEQKLSLSGLSDPATAIRVGKLLGAQELLYGSFLESNGKLRVICRLVDTKTTALLASETVAGKGDDFGQLLDDLTLKVVADLAVVRPPGAEATLKAARPVRQLEAAVHYVTAKDALLRGNLPQASESFAQAVLVEPENVQLHAGLVDTLFQQQEYDKTVEAASRALAQKFRRRLQPMRIDMMTAMLDSLQYRGRFKELEEASHRALKEFPEKKNFFSERLARSYLGQNRLDDAVVVLFGDEKGKAPKLPPDTINQSVMRQYTFYHEAQGEWSGIKEVRQECARRRAIIAARAIEYFDGKRDDYARKWGMFLMQPGLVPNWLESYEEVANVLPEERRKEIIRRGFEVFSWIPEVAEVAERKKNKRRRTNGIPPVDPNVKTVDQNFDLFKDAKLRNVVPPASDQLLEELDSWIDDKTIEDYEQVRALLAEAEKTSSDEKKKENRDRVKRILEAQVRIFGIATLCGAEVVKLSEKLGINRTIPEQSILVWGGDTEAFVSYSKLFSPAGFTVHPFRLKHVTPEHLAPYRLVVLARTGNSPYTPSDLLALRSYVATGGSLLVIASPGWSPATTGIHNALLRFFDASVDDSLTVKAESTRITPHPITAGIEKAIAKTAAGITASESTSLIQAGDKTVLAALPYRKGRVVISTFGQWFLPDSSVFDAKVAIERAMEIQRIRGFKDTPLEIGTAQEQQLLRNVVGWLTAPKDLDKVDVAQIAGFRVAYDVALRAFAMAVPWDSMKPALEKLVSDAPPGVWKEEALWAAGECAQQMVYRYRGNWYHGSYSYEPPLVLDAEPAWYRDLVRDFSDSPLRPYAEFRLGECERRAQLNIDMRQRKGSIPIYREASPDAAISVFEKLDLEPGSYPWAWTHMRCGNLNMVKSNWDRAAEHFRMVSEKMPTSPEKSMALLSQAYCYRFLGKSAEARRCCDAVLALPPILCEAEDYYIDWAPRSAVVAREVGPSDELAHEILSSLARQNRN